MDGFPPVRLKYATSQSFSVGGISPAYTALMVKVENIAFTKDVAIHRDAGGGSWTDEPLNWDSNYGDYDVFRQSASYTSEFAIRYSVAGMTYWDNNNGANYHLSNFTNTVGGNVALNRATARIGFEAGGGFTFRTSWVEGEIYVNNLAYQKAVGIRLSTDGGSTWRDTFASYAGLATDSTYATTYGVEVWRYRTPELNYDDGASSHRFAVFYNHIPAGQWFWDNDFGRDYRLDKADGTTIR